MYASTPGVQRLLACCCSLAGSSNPLPQRRVGVNGGGAGGGGGVAGLLNNLGKGDETVPAVALWEEGGVTSVQGGLLVRIRNLQTVRQSENLWWHLRSHTFFTHVYHCFQPGERLFYSRRHLSYGEL